jgi:hypothetical protein
MHVPVSQQSPGCMTLMQASWKATAHNVAYRAEKGCLEKSQSQVRRRVDAGMCRAMAAHWVEMAS